MSSSRPTFGPLLRRGSLCYRALKDRSRPHPDPYRECELCGRTICLDCIGGYGPNGTVICVECAAPEAYGVQESRRGGFARSTGPALGSVGSGARGLLGGIWGGVRWVGRELAEPFTAQPGPRGQPGGDLRIWWISGDLVFQGIVTLLVVLAAIVVMTLIYGWVNDIPLLRVIVAIFGAGSFWVVVAIQLLYRLQGPLGTLAARVIAFLLALVLAGLFGAWLIHQTWLDGLLGLFG
jgi:hypothetical protein